LGTDQLTSISCAAGSGTCSSLGDQATNPPDYDFVDVEVAPGGSWSGTVIPGPSDIAAASCGAPTHCVVVGTKRAANGTTTTLVETWNRRTWSTD